MQTRSLHAALIVLAATASSLAQHGHVVPDPKPDIAAPLKSVGPILFDNLGTHHRAITTKNEQAQKFFDQGLRLFYAFNLDEAQRSFEEAARLDPDCAMAHWGIAMTLAPNINIPSMPDRAKAGFAAAGTASKLAERPAGASEVEKALIDAVSKRFSESAPTGPQGQAELDGAYADAMRLVYTRFQQDADAAALFAESMMTLRPWDLWKSDGTPQPGTEEIVAALEWVLAKAPDHPGANHYYIHAVEASPHPEKALASADKLPSLMPGAGHMVHMPSHIYMRLGRYEDAAEANRRAIAVDKDYASKVGGFPGFYPMYAAHNYHFLSAAAAMQGNSAEAIKAARDMVAMLPPDMFTHMPEMDLALTQPILMLVRFGRWEEVLTEPDFPPGLTYPAAIRSFARGMAYAAQGDEELTKAELDLVVAAMNTTPPEVRKFQNSAKTLLTIARHVLQGRTASLQKRWVVAEQNLRLAIKLEDGLRYDEPSNWFAPVRQVLGAGLMAAEKYDEAVAVYQEDLARNPENGWSLYAISRALRAQEKDDDARPYEARFKEAWKNADVKIKASWY